MKKIFILITLILFSVIIISGCSKPKFSDDEIKYWKNTEVWMGKDSKISEEVNQILINVRTEGVIRREESIKIKTISDDYSNFIAEVKVYPSPELFSKQKEIFVRGMEQRLLYFNKLYEWALINIEEGDEIKGGQALDEAKQYLNKFNDIAKEHDIEIKWVLDKREE